VSMPYRGAQAQDRREATRGPVARRFVGADHRESHGRVEAARRRRGPGVLWQGFAVRQRDMAKGGPPVADVSFAVGIEREDPGLPLVAESLVSELEDGREAVVQEGVVQPPVDRATCRSVAERGQPDLSTLGTVS